MDNSMPWELSEDDGWTPYRPGNLSKILTCALCLIPFIGVGLMVL